MPYRRPRRLTGRTVPYYLAGFAASTILVFALLERGGWSPAAGQAPPPAAPRLPDSRLVLATGNPNVVVLGRDQAFVTLPAGSLDQPLPGLRAGLYVKVVALVPRVTTASAAAALGQTVPYSATAQPVEAHVEVASVDRAQQALTLMVPADDVARLAWLRGQGASFSLAQVRPQDSGGSMAGVTASTWDVWAQAGGGGTPRASTGDGARGAAGHGTTTRRTNKTMRTTRMTGRTTHGSGR